MQKFNDEIGHHVGVRLRSADARDLFGAAHARKFAGSAKRLMPEVPRIALVPGVGDVARRRRRTLREVDVLRHLRHE